MDAESRINAALGKILRNFNFLELNLGLCLRLLENPDNPVESHDFLYKAGLPKILAKLKEHVDRCTHIKDVSEFHEWAERVEGVRKLRNYYVHGTWEYLPSRRNAPLGFRIPPWRTERILGNAEGNMRIEELEADAERIEQAFHDFTRIRRKLHI